MKKQHLKDRSGDRPAGWSSKRELSGNNEQRHLFLVSKKQGASKTPLSAQKAGTNSTEERQEVVEAAQVGH